MKIKSSNLVCVVVLFFTLFNITACSTNTNDAVLDNKDLKPLTLGRGSTFSQGNENGYYELVNYVDITGGFNIMYTDYASKSKVVLCSSSSCEHNTEACTGYIEGAPLRIFTINDKLIIFNYKLVDSNYVRSVLSADLNGENRKILYTFDPAESESSEFFFDGKCIYFIMSRPVQTKDDLLYQQFLVKLNIENGSLTDIINLSEKYDNAYVNIYGSCVDELVLSINSSDTKLKSIKVDGSNGKYVDDILNAEIAAKVFYGENEYIASYTDHTFTRKNLISGKTAVLPWPNDIEFNFINSTFGNIVDGIPMFSSHEYSRENNRETRLERMFLIDFDNGEINELNLKYTFDGMSKPIVIAAETKNQFLVMNGIENITHYYPANDKGLTEDIVPTPQYALIDKSDFWRGVPNYENIDYIG